MVYAQIPFYIRFQASCVFQKTKVLFVILLETKAHVMRVQRKFNY